jgi:BirA family biotin operon repressor/biotin-[acetyl-CoA-carboxylase] ligase
MALHPLAAAAGYRLLSYESIGSTNTTALDLGRAGEAGPVWITARRQTAGRGRRGHEWISPPGNLCATLLLIDPAPGERAAELSFVTALALHDALIDRTPLLRDRLTLKWPNDVLCGGEKLSGILIESEIVGRGLAVAIGIGVNCRHHPPRTAYPATDCRAAGADMTAEDLLEALTAAMPRRLAQWRRDDGFKGVCADWLAHAEGVGGEMRVRLPDREIFGRFEALDEHGRLLLRLADGRLQAITAGDVFPLGSGQGRPKAQARAS